MEMIVDASVLAKWFKTDNEQHLAQAMAIRARYERGELLIAAPPLLFIDVLNTAARRWHWDAARLQSLAARFMHYGFRMQQPSLTRIATWSARGLSAYDASYVALAEERGSVVVTADDEMIKLGGSYVRALADEPTS